MSPHHLRLLADSAMKAHFNTDEIIFREGEPANGFYLIQKGKVVLESHVHDKAYTVVDVLGTGDVLGWSWLFPPFLWHFNARALVPTEAIFIYATPLRDEGNFDHELGYELLKRMAEVMLARLQALRRHLLSISAEVGKP
jgi:CRP-like cAMP-binding protein